jgi:3-oxoacyl-[acyl-carrier-protein] synthase-3
MHFVRQEGREVFKFAVKGMTAITHEIMQRNGIAAAEVGLYVPHQANLRIIDAVWKKLGLTEEQVAINIDLYANTTSATIPTALRMAYDEGRLAPGDIVIFCSFGAGFTWGATLLRWTVA